MWLSGCHELVVIASFSGIPRSSYAPYPPLRWRGFGTRGCRHICICVGIRTLVLTTNDVALIVPIKPSICGKPSETLIIYYVLVQSRHNRSEIGRAHV